MDETCFLIFVYLGGVREDNNERNVLLRALLLLRIRNTYNNIYQLSSDIINKRTNNQFWQECAVFRGTNQ